MTGSVFAVRRVPWRHPSGDSLRLDHDSGTAIAVTVVRVARECPLSGAASPVPGAPQDGLVPAACATSGPTLSALGALPSTQTLRRDTGADRRQRGNRHSGAGRRLVVPPTVWGQTPPDWEKSAGRDA